MVFGIGLPSSKMAYLITAVTYVGSPMYRGITQYFQIAVYFGSPIYHGILQYLQIAVYVGSLVYHGIIPYLQIPVYFGSPMYHGIGQYFQIILCLSLPKFAKGNTRDTVTCVICPEWPRYRDMCDMPRVADIPRHV
jgi:hypothetical protein